MTMESLEPAIAIRIQKWLDGPFDEETKAEIRKQLQKDPQKLADAFFKDLSFGTGGMRGVMGVGTNRMNLYTIRRAAKGLSNYILKQPEKESGHAVFIGYDVRHNSLEFAWEAAKVLAADQIRVYLTKKISSTPFVSFGCRYYDCTAAIMITASHNPPEYNGFKVYWSDGAQVVPPHDQGIIQEVKKIDLSAPIPKEEEGIHEVGEELDALYLNEIDQLALIKKSTPLHLIYTNLHGTGIRHLPDALKRRGFDQLTLVEEQKSLDGNFPNAPSPNPENPEALKAGIDLLLKTKGDLLLATDPDADRIAAVANQNQVPVILTGNQIACILLSHILENHKSLPENGACIKTIVTTELFKKITESFDLSCIDVLTGFKYIGEKIAEWEASFGGYQYIFGAEESYGYLYGTYVRDKDAISSACLLAEAASLAKGEGETLVDRLYTLYQKHGIHRETLINVAFQETREGLEKMKNQMLNLRKNPPLEIDGKRVIAIDDYLESKTSYFEEDRDETISLPKSNVLRFWLEGKRKLVIRPSGTEPKIKIYAEVVNEKFTDLKRAIQQCDAELKKLTTTFKESYL